MKRFALSMALALALMATPASADGGPLMASLVATATGINRAYDATLEAAAASETARVAAQGYLSHRALTELTSAGWSYGDVLAWNRYYADPFATAVTGWMTSPEHEPILRDPAYQRIGCDHVLSGVTHYFVCIVGTPSGVMGPPIVETIPDAAMEPR